VHLLDFNKTILCLNYFNQVIGIQTVFQGISGFSGRLSGDQQAYLPYNKFREYKSDNLFITISYLQMILFPNSALDLLSVSMT
jgi:hypothetical protein